MYFEIIKWFRSKRIFVVLFIFCISGITSPLIAYYSDSIIKNFSSSSIEKVIVSAPNWKLLIESYFKNTEQLILFIVVFLVSQVCTIEKNESLQLFYKTRANRAGAIYNSKVMAGLLIVSIGIIVSDICALYMEWGFFDSSVNYIRLVYLFTFHLLAFNMFVLLGVTVSIWLTSPFVASCMVEIFIMLSSVLSDTQFYKKWLPNILLNPQKYLYEGISLEKIGMNILIVTTVIIVCIIFIQMKPIHKKSSEGMYENDY